MAEVRKAKRDGIAKRSERARVLKEELNRVLELVVHAREALENELNSEFAQKKLGIDKPFVDKLKSLAACFTTLTESRIRLDKAEREMEAEMTPQEEKQAVRAFVMGVLSNDERREFIKSLWEAHKEACDPRGARSGDLPE